jgi:hypothetical protein
MEQAYGPATATTNSKPSPFTSHVTSWTFKDFAISYEKALNTHAMGYDIEFTTRRL